MCIPHNPNDARGPLVRGPLVVIHEKCRQFGLVLLGYWTAIEGNANVGAAEQTQWLNRIEMSEFKLLAARTPPPKILF